MSADAKVMLYTLAAMTMPQCGPYFAAKHARAASFYRSAKF
jgi:hypothetical protein